MKTPDFEINNFKMNCPQQIFSYYIFLSSDYVSYILSLYPTQIEITSQTDKYLVILF